MDGCSLFCLGISVFLKMMPCYDDAMRTIIDLPEPQVKQLALYCDREHISRAEAVRRAVGQLLESGHDVLPPAFGGWKGKKVDARKFVESIRSEWGSRP